jgi:hypothetical protein
VCGGALPLARGAFFSSKDALEEKGEKGGGRKCGGGEGVKEEAQGFHCVWSLGPYPENVIAGRSAARSRRLPSSFESIRRKQLITHTNPMSLSHNTSTTAPHRHGFCCGGDPDAGDGHGGGRRRRGQGE